MGSPFISRERERQLGMLFGCALAASLVCGIVADRVPKAGKIIMALLGCGLLALLLRAYLRWRQKPGPAPVGLLSPDERSKARSKLKSPAPAAITRPGTGSGRAARGSLMAD